MSLTVIILAAGTLTGMALVLTYILGWANRAFHVEVDPRIDAVNDTLPGVNCGGCGYVGWGEYAEAVVLDSAPVNKCTVGGANCTAALAEIMGLDVDAALPVKAVIHCGAKYDDRLGRSPYNGEMECRAANLVADVQGCTYGCLGFGDCSRACNYDAIQVVDGLATVNYDNCIGCGACAKVCPRNIITITPFKAKRMLAVACSNLDKGKEVTRVCKVGCLGCRACTRISNLFVVENNLSTLNYDEYSADRMDELIKASEKCPRQRLVFAGPPLAEGETEISIMSPEEAIVPDFKTTVDDTEWRG
jgi:electron transport complex protein RnfB